MAASTTTTTSTNGTSTIYGGVKMRHKPGGPRRLTSQEEINKRLSLPADLKLPDNFVEKQAVSPTLDGPLSRATRRQSLSEIGFGRMDTYTKLDKLGEVCTLNKNTKWGLIDFLGKEYSFFNFYFIYEKIVADHTKQEIEIVQKKSMYVIDILSSSKTWGSEFSSSTTIELTALSRMAFAQIKKL